jgi:hypothetical protein
MIPEYRKDKKPQNIRRKELKSKGMGITNTKGK